MKLRSHYTVVFILALFFGLLQPQTALAGQAIWIDTDPACGNAVTDDVDDCWALLMALRSRTLVALGPLTNFATLVLLHPEKMSNVKQVIAIAGRRAESRPVFYPGDSRLFHLHDLNLQKDSTAFSVILESSIPIPLVPYEVASKVSITSKDLDQLSSGGSVSGWLASISRPWLRFWNSRLKSDGFFHSTVWQLEC